MGLVCIQNNISGTLVDGRVKIIYYLGACKENCHGRPSKDAACASRDGRRKCRITAHQMAITPT